MWHQMNEWRTPGKEVWKLYFRNVPLLPKGAERLNETEVGWKFVTVKYVTGSRFLDAENIDRDNKMCEYC
jgi:hypothetical protein